MGTFEISASLRAAGRNSIIMHIALTWYESEADYKAVEAVFPVDETKSSIAYAQLILRILKDEKAVQEAGHVPVRTSVKAIPFVAYCQSNNLPICRNSLRQYTIWKMGGELARE